jgi:hypothetical protein
MDFELTIYILQLINLILQLPFITHVDFCSSFVKFFHVIHCSLLFKVNIVIFLDWNYNQFSDLEKNKNNVVVVYLHLQKTQIAISCNMHC